MRRFIPIVLLACLLLGHLSVSAQDTTAVPAQCGAELLEEILTRLDSDVTSTIAQYDVDESGTIDLDDYAWCIDRWSQQTSTGTELGRGCHEESNTIMCRPVGIIRQIGFSSPLFSGVFEVPETFDGEVETRFQAKIVAGEEVIEEYDRAGDVCEVQVNSFEDSQTELTFEPRDGFKFLRVCVKNIWRLPPGIGRDIPDRWTMTYQSTKVV